MDKPAVFISAVSSEFGSIRRLVAESLTRLGYEPITQEIFGTESGDLSDVLRRKIDQCEGVVHIAGVSYGAEPPAPDPQFGRVSYTQFEFLYARHKNLKTWVILPGDGCTPDKPVDQLDLPHDPATPDPIAWQAERRELQRRYRESIQGSSHLWQRPNSHDGLILSVERMRDELDLLRKQAEERYHDQKSQLDRIERLLASQVQANPKTEPKLSDSDQALLDHARRQGDLKSRAAAAVLQPDADTDALLTQLQAQHDAQAFDLAMLNGKRWYFARPIAQFDKAVPFFERAMHLRPDSFEAHTYAANAHTCSRLDEITAHHVRAIEIYEGTLKLVRPRSADWAKTQNNLGNAWLFLPTGDHAKNLQTAIDCYTRALEVRTKADFPADWATTQNNLGVAWGDLPTGDRAKNLQTAIGCYTRALEVRTKADHPVDWAMTQNNLGNAWLDLPTGDRATNLQTAIDCYTRALEVRTKADFPADWAMTQNNLGGAWRNLPTGDPARDLQTAIACYTRALDIYTRADFPADWAMTQSNLGEAWADLADQPKLSAEQTRCGLLRRAIACCKGALTICTPDAFPRDHADTMKIMDISRGAYEAARCAEKIPFDDIPPAE